MSFEEDEETLATELEIACAEILSAARFEPTVRELLQETPGHWVRLDAFAATCNASGRLFVTWIPLPDEPEGEFVLIIFLHDEISWTTTATYNRGRILKHIIPT